MTPLDTFVSLSAALTGYDATVLKPQNDTQQLSELYFDTLNKNEAATIVKSLLNKFTTDGNVTGIMKDAVLAPVAKNIVRMWYLGIWYTDDQQQNGFVISSKAYKNGLVWGAMGAHPMGYSQENFGYWSTPPKMPSLT